MVNISVAIFLVLLHPCSHFALALTGHSPNPASASTQAEYKPHFSAKIANSIAKGERRAQERSVEVRELCPQCIRPPAICVCSALPTQKLFTQTRVLILQHPTERRKRNFSTVPLLGLVLENIEVIGGYVFDFNDLYPVVDFIKNNPGKKPLLLYPHADAISLDDDSCEQRSNAGDSDSDNVNSKLPTRLKEQANLLIILDGTWAEAKRMIRGSPTLIEQCQLVQFTSESKSIYDAVRKEPDPHCISTLEACAKTLDLLEPDRNQRESISHYLTKVLRVHVENHLDNASTNAVSRSANASRQKRLFAKNN